jgi:hypothetical protein
MYVEHQLKGMGTLVTVSLACMPTAEYGYRFHYVLYVAKASSGDTIWQSILFSLMLLLFANNTIYSMCAT